MIKISKRSQKRFRKLLYSRGYQRNEANKVMQYFKEHNLTYYLYDLDYFQTHKHSILWNLYIKGELI